MGLLSTYTAQAMHTQHFYLSLIPENSTNNSMFEKIPEYFYLMNLICIKYNIQGVFGVECAVYASWPQFFFFEIFLTAGKKFIEIPKNYEFSSHIKRTGVVHVQGVYSSNLENQKMGENSGKMNSLREVRENEGDSGKIMSYCCLVLTLVKFLCSIDQKAV